jgi:UDP-N-acetylglucosamine acyltransferase
MALTISDLIHPTAVIDPDAQLADDVRVGPYAIIEGPVEVG